MTPKERRAFYYYCSSKLNRAVSTFNPNIEKDIEIARNWLIEYRLKKEN